MLRSGISFNGFLRCEGDTVTPMLQKLELFFFFLNSVMFACTENIHNSLAAVTQSNKMPFQSLSSFIVIPIRHLHKYIIHGSNPGFGWGDIKCDSVRLCACVCLYVLVCARECVCPDVCADGRGMKQPILFVVCTFLIQLSTLHQ